MEHLTKFRSKSRSLTLWVALLVFVLGVFAGPLIESRTKVLFSDPYLPSFIYVIVVIVIGTSILIWNSVRKSVETIEKDIQKISHALGHKLRVLPYQQGYNDLQNRINAASNEVRILSKYVFDWDAGRAIYDQNRLISNERKAAYKKINNKIKISVNDGTPRFVKIVQVPEGHSLEEIFVQDPIYAEQCKLLAEVGKDHPEIASLRTTAMVFSNTFALIDQAYLYIEFEFEQLDKDIVHAPFIIAFEDPSSKVLGSFLQIHQKIEANSKLFF